MEIFLDFGMFELAAALGLAALGRAVYRRAWLAFAILAVSIVAPLALIFLGAGEVPRWIAAIALTTALINAGVIVPALKAGRLLEKSS